MRRNSKAHTPTHWVQVFSFPTHWVKFQAKLWEPFFTTHPPVVSLDRQQGTSVSKCMTDSSLPTCNFTKHIR